MASVRRDRKKPLIAPTASPEVRERVKAMTRLIDDHERELAKLKHSRKSLILKDWMRHRRLDPVFKAKMGAAMQAAWADPVKAAKMQAKGRPRVLPDMTPEQRQIYKRWRFRYHVAREVALQEAFA